MTEQMTFFLPSNMMVPPELRGAHVDGDTYMICERIKEISDRLRVVPLDHETYRYGIVELCTDGVERLVMRVPELDNRVLERLRYLMGVSLADRVAEIEKEQAKHEADWREQEEERLWQELGDPMRHALEKSGFADRPVSYPKSGVATKGKFRS